MLAADAVRSAKVKGYAISTYRSILNIALLTAGFAHFPEHTTFVALAILAFWHGIEAVGLVITTVASAQNLLDDLAERKTRHTILLAAEGVGHFDDFWAEVDRRVGAEISGDTTEKSFLGQAATFFLSILWRLVSDVSAVVVASLLSA